LNVKVLKPKKNQYETKKKQGHIGASKTGASLFDKNSVFQEFVRMATSDPCLSMRGYYSC
jgi:hypothetical protein